MLPGETGRESFQVPGEFVRYEVALRPEELAAGFLGGWVNAQDAQWLAWLRTCDLGDRAGLFAEIAAAEPSRVEVVCQQIVGDQEAGLRVWEYLASRWSHPASADGGDLDPLEAGRREFLLDRAASGEGMNWEEFSALLGTDRPEEVDAAFVRGEPLVGVAVIGLALTHPNSEVILPRVARAMESADKEVRRQGVVALAHVARLHRSVDQRCLSLLRKERRGNEADDDLWTFVDHRDLPWWLWRHKLTERLAWLIIERWRR